ncbi:MAG TPA: TM2 domain-containing protein [Candidatus Fimivicinus intestinavium]|nr:TM2 domain-containing protein [Candidatus Fimivicinus intestinavium]
MNPKTVDTFLAKQKKFFPKESLKSLRSDLLELPDEMLVRLEQLEFHSPNKILLISLLFGSLGIDRFLLSDKGVGLLKMFTCGCLGILTVYDWINIRKMTCAYNLVKLYNSFSREKIPFGRSPKQVMDSIVANRKALMAAGKGLWEVGKDFQNSMFLH